ncbi:hypothetical protein Bca101_041086 [Brassica carinata]
MDGRDRKAHSMTFPNKNITRDKIITRIYIFHHKHLEENLSCVWTQRSFHKNLIFYAHPLLVFYGFSINVQITSSRNSVGST